MSIETDDLYDRLAEMTEEDRQKTLDPICYALQGSVKPYGDLGGEVLPNRIVALAVIDLYRAWQREIFERN